LAEFDEAIPIVEQNDIKLSKADMEVQALEKQVYIKYILINFMLFYLSFMYKCVYIFHFNICYINKLKLFVFFSVIIH